MIGVGWFERNGQWHTPKLDEPSHTECGIQFVTAPTVQLSTEESPVPPNPCSTCLVAVGMRYVEDEPLDVAMARGYERITDEPDNSQVE